MKRSELLFRAKKGLKIKERIIHEEIMKAVKMREYRQKLIKMRQQQKEVSNVLNLPSSSQISRNTMSIVIGTKV
jgi:hypothetical protein